MSVDDNVMFSCGVYRFIKFSLHFFFVYDPSFSLFIFAKGQVVFVGEFSEVYVECAKFSGEFFSDCGFAYARCACDEDDAFAHISYLRYSG